MVFFTNQHTQDPIYIINENKTNEGVESKYFKLIS